jgi:hypothetical protein
MEVHAQPRTIMWDEKTLAFQPILCYNAIGGRENGGNNLPIEIWKMLLFQAQEEAEIALDWREM